MSAAPASLAASRATLLATLPGILLYDALGFSLIEEVSVTLPRRRGFPLRPHEPGNPTD